MGEIQAMSRKIFALSAVALVLLGQDVLPAPSPVVVSQTAPSVIIPLRARELGLCDEILVKIGDKVSAQQIVARLDHFRQLHAFQTARRRLQNRGMLTIAEADLKEKSSALEEAQLKHRRRQISDAEFTRASVQHEVALARLSLARDSMEQAQSDCDLAEQALQERFIRSPVAGRVMQIHKTLGERAQAGDPVISIGDYSQLTAEQIFTKEAAAKLVTGALIPIKTAAGGPLIEARVAAIAAAPKAANGEKILTLIFDNPESQLAGPEDEPEAPPLLPPPLPAPGKR